MNLNEFLEMKNEFAEYIYNYEYFLKCGAINDCYYNYYFSQYLDEIKFLDTESKVMASVIDMKANNEPEEKINEFVTKAKESYANEKAMIENKNRLCRTIVENNNKMSNEDKKQFEIDYLAYVKENHPIVKCFINDNEEQIFNMLNKLYKENNYSGFKGMLEMNKNSFKVPEYKEADFTKISAYYYDMKKNINADFLKKQNQYPFNKMEVLKNEISVAREAGDLKAKLSKFREANKNLHRDYELNFGKDFSLI